MKIKEELEIRKMAGETVLIMQGRYGMDLTKVVSFNATAEWLWRTLFGKTFTPADVTRLLVERFEVTTETAEADAKEWIEKLKQCHAFEDDSSR